jgi:hypothetical protein
MAIRQAVFNGGQLWLWSGRWAQVLDASQKMDFRSIDDFQLSAKQLCPAQNNRITAAFSNGRYALLGTPPGIGTSRSPSDCIEDVEGLVRVVSGTCLSRGVGEVQGRLEVRTNVTEQWGTVCNDFFGPEEVLIVCNRLGLKPGISLNRNNGNVPDSEDSPQNCGPGVDPIVLDDLQCNGHEVSLFNCLHIDQADNCYHHEDAALSCRRPEAANCVDGNCKVSCPAPGAFPLVRTPPACSITVAEVPLLTDINGWSHADVTQWAGIDNNLWVAERNNQLELITSETGGGGFNITDTVTDLGNGLWLKAGTPGQCLYSLRRINETTLLYRIEVMDNQFGEPEALKSFQVEPSMFDVSPEGYLAIVDDNQRLTLFAKVHAGTDAVPGIHNLVIESTTGVTTGVTDKTTHSGSQQLQSFLNLTVLVVLFGRISLSY